MSCFDLTHAPVATAARAAATGLVSMSTRPDPEGLGTVEIATRCLRLRVVWDLRELTHQQHPGHGAVPPDLVQLRSTLPVGALVLGNNRDKMSGTYKFPGLCFTVKSYEHV